MTEMRNSHIPDFYSWHVQLTTSVGGAALGRYNQKGCVSAGAGPQLQQLTMLAAKLL